MPGTLGQLIRNRRRIDIPLDDGNSIFIEYRPAAITEGLIAELQAAQQEATRDDGSVDIEMLTPIITRYLLTVIEAWDVTDKDGVIIPLTSEGFRDKVGYEDKYFLFNTIQEDANMGEAKGATSLPPSESISKPTAQRATSRRHSPTGTH